MLDRVDFPLTNATITGFVLETGYTDFATIQLVLSIIQDDGLINVESSRSCTSYTLTTQGKEMLQYFGNKIPDNIKKDVNEYLTVNKYELKQAANIISEYYRTTNGEYAVHCCIKENGSSLIDLTMSVPDEELADHMCGKWKASSQSIYEYIIKQLM
jgi:DNA-binding PadR family transcriptional regulator